ncbi:MAG: PPOX class F420-dependent oxidoreductase [Actinobacteria bacterium]|nr:PPOX class F420-dependent oxidoreductase [Actinomycetota bacterium]
MDELTSEAIRLLQGRNLAYLATTNPDGSPHVAPLWADVDAERGLILLNTAQGRKKVRNIRRDPRVAISSHDPSSPHPPLVVRGTVVNVTGEGADAHIDFLSRKYNDGEPWEPVPGQVRLILEIRPDRVHYPVE